MDIGIDNKKDDDLRNVNYLTDSSPLSKTPYSSIYSLICGREWGGRVQMSEWIEIVDAGLSRFH